MTLRVIVCYTGGVGSELIRQLLRNPGFELVGVLVHSEDKDSRDVGEIIGTASTGIYATCDIAALTALGADVMSWHGLKWEPEVIARFLRAGTSVYSGMGGWYLPNQPEYRMLQDAAEQGGAALVAGGNIPGLISDVLPLFCSGYSSNIRIVRAMQRNYIPHYPSAIQMGEYVGIGQSVPEVPFDPSSVPSEIDRLWMWGIAQSAALVAQGLGVTMDELRMTNKEFGASKADMVLKPSGLPVAKGAVAGVRWTFTAFSKGKPYYELVNELTTRLDIGSGWRDSEHAANWSVVVEGSPTIHCELGLVANPNEPDHVAALNAARALNFLPRIAVAAPGWRSILDVPAPVGTFASSR